MTRRSVAPPVVLAFIRNQAEERYLADALSGVAAVRPLADESALREEIARRPPTALVIHVDERPSALLIDVGWETRRARPGLPIVVYCAGLSPSGSAVRGIVRIPRTIVICRDTDNVRDVMRDVMDPVEWQDARLAVVSVLDALLPDLRAREFANYCVSHFDAQLSVASVAEATGVAVRTVGRMRPKPQTLICWCRLLVAASLIDRLGHEIDTIARLVNFGSASEFRMMLRRRAKLITSQLETGKALTLVADALRRSKCGVTESPDDFSPMAD